MPICLDNPTFEVPHSENPGREEPHIVSVGTREPLLAFDWPRTTGIWSNCGAFGIGGDAIGPGGAGNPTQIGHLPGWTFASGSSQYLSVADDARLRPGTTDYAVAVWLLNNMGGGSYAGIACKGLSSAAPAGSWGIMRHGGSLTAVGCAEATAAGGAWAYYYAMDMPANQWNFAVFTRVGTSRSSYRNGILANTAASAVQNSASAAAFQIARSAAASYLSSSIGMVQLFITKGLSAENVRTMYEEQRHIFSV